MESSAISVVSYLLNSIAIILIFLFLAGMMHRLSSVLLAIFAYPVYISLFTLEGWLGNRKSSNRRFLCLNIPSGGKNKFIMNFMAFLVVFFLMPNLLSLYLIFTGSPIADPSQIFMLFFGNSGFQLICNGLSILCVFSIYLISYRVPMDNRSSFDKIDSLTIPSLWKTVIDE